MTLNGIVRAAEHDAARAQSIALAMRGAIVRDKIDDDAKIPYDAARDAADCMSHLARACRVAADVQNGYAAHVDGFESGMAIEARELYLGIQNLVAKYADVLIEGAARDLYDALPDNTERDAYRTLVTAAASHGGDKPPVWPATNNDDGGAQA